MHVRQCLAPQGFLLQLSKPVEWLNLNVTVKRIPSYRRRELYSHDIEIDPH